MLSTAVANILRCRIADHSHLVQIVVHLVRARRVLDHIARFLAVRAQRWQGYFLDHVEWYIARWWRTTKSVTTQANRTLGQTEFVLTELDIGRDGGMHFPQVVSTSFIIDNCNLFYCTATDH